MKKRREYIEGFRITRDGDSLLVEATDYHATPLRLSREELSNLGLRLVPLPESGKQPVEDGKGEREREV